MSKSIPISKPKSVITQTQLIADLSQRTGISQATVRTLLNELPEYIFSQLSQAHAVRISNFLTFHLRRRNYTEERRSRFAMGHATLPEFCYYPYAQFSTNFRAYIADHKHDIAQAYDDPQD